MDDQPQPTYRSGYVALIGRPNVGKSTLLNALLGEKVAAVSALPQTTRNRILGVRTLPDAQVVFLDTPGIHDARGPFNRMMVQTAERALTEADLLYFVVDLPPKQPARVHPEDAEIAKSLAGLDTPKLLLINKVDLFGRKDELLAWLSCYQELIQAEEVIPVSALRGSGLDIVLENTVSRLPVGPQLYPDDMYTDQAERFLAAEVIREKIFRNLRKELPYATAVTIEAWTEREDRIQIEGTIHVERDSQKGIIIGKQGAMLKKIGTAARLELERTFATSVTLNLFVRVEQNWRKDPRSMRKLGYEP